MDRATADYNEQLRPLLLEQHEVQTKAQLQKIDAATAAARLTAIKTKIAGVDLDIKTKYGPKAAAAALAKAQASIATEVARAAASEASARHSDAETGEVEKRTALLGTGEGGGHGRGGGRRASASDRNADEYDAAMNGLSPTATNFYSMLYSTNNPPTRAQAMLALHASARGNKAFTPSDVANLETLINNRESQFVTPGEQRTAANKDAAAQPLRDIRASISKLPAGVQQVILKMQKEGVSIEGIRDAVDSSPSLPDNVKAAAKAALGG